MCDERRFRLYDVFIELTSELVFMRLVHGVSTISPFKAISKHWIDAVLRTANNEFCVEKQD